MTVKEIEKNYGICGLVCALCSYNANCAGCQCKDENCEVKTCCLSKGLTYCYLCEEWPCEKNMHKGIRTRTFNSIAKSEGLDKLAEYLHKNLERGIFYHRPDGLTGDYDKCKTEQEVLELLKNGKPDPYDKCPEYESENFHLRLVSVDDAEDLLECYKNPTISVQGNEEGCNYGYGSQTVDEMRDFIRRWLDEYKNRQFVRLSIVDKRENKAVGTIEIFNSHESHTITRRVDIMLDVTAKYETEEHLSELFKISDSFFHDFKCDKIVTQIMPEAICRKTAAEENGYEFYPVSAEWKWEHCYIKKMP